MDTVRTDIIYRCDPASSLGLIMLRESERISKAKQNISIPPPSVCLLDGGVIGPGRELAPNEDPCREVDLALEGLVIEFVDECGGRHDLWGRNTAIRGDYQSSSWLSTGEKRQGVRYLSNPSRHANAGETDAGGITCRMVIRLNRSALSPFHLVSNSRDYFELEHGERLSWLSSMGFISPAIIDSMGSTRRQSSFATFKFAEASVSPKYATRKEGVV